MKFIKCLKEQCLTDPVGIVDNAVKAPCFYTVDYVLKNKTHLFKRKVFTISATNMEVGDNQKPVVVYYLGSKK